MFPLDNQAYRQREPRFTRYLLPFTSNEFRKIGGITERTWERSLTFMKLDFKGTKQSWTWAISIFAISILILFTSSRKGHTQNSKLVIENYLHEFNLEPSQYEPIPLSVFEMYGFTEGKQRYWFIRNPNEENLTQVLEIAESFLSFQDDNTAFNVFLFLKNQMGDKGDSRSDLHLCGKYSYYSECFSTNWTVYTEMRFPLHYYFVLFKFKNCILYLTFSGVDASGKNILDNHIQDILEKIINEKLGPQMKHPLSFPYIILILISLALIAYKRGPPFHYYYRKPAPLKKVRASPKCEYLEPKVVQNKETKPNEVPNNKSKSKSSSSSRHKKVSYRVRTKHKIEESSTHQKSCCDKPPQQNWICSNHSIRDSASITWIIYPNCCDFVCPVVTSPGLLNGNITKYVVCEEQLEKQEQSQDKLSDSQSIEMEPIQSATSEEVVEEVDSKINISLADSNISEQIIHEIDQAQSSEKIIQEAVPEKCFDLRQMLNEKFWISPPPSQKQNFERIYCFCCGVKGHHGFDCPHKA